MEAEKHDTKSFLVGICDVEAWNYAVMKRSSMSVSFGYDGPVLIGEGFGCIHHKHKDKDK